jgi:hypothetical protein
MPAQVILIFNEFDYTTMTITPCLGLLAQIDSMNPIWTYLMGHEIAHSIDSASLILIYFNH